MASRICMSLSRKDTEPQLDRGLTLAHTIALVVGAVIGTGVFLKAAVMAQTVGSPSLVLWAWALAGLLSMAGGLTYAELGALLPHAGGEYVYLLEAYGEGPAFLFGWMRFVMGSAGSIASLAVGFATFLAAILPINHVWAEYSYRAFGQTLVWRFGTQQVLALSVIILLSALNCGRVVLGGQVQVLLTILKVAGIAVIVGGILLFSRGGTVANLARPTGVKAWTGFASFGTAMLAALWAYEGWNQMPMCAGEV